MDFLPKDAIEHISVEVEIGEGFYVPIYDKIDGFCISYGDNTDYYSDEKDRFCYPNAKRLVCEVKDVMTELDVRQPECFILCLLSLTPKGHPQRAFSCVGAKKQKFIVGFSIWRTDNIAQIKCKHHLYHELMHIKDTISNRFPSIGRGIRNMALINFIWGFSIEGRLEKMGKLHLEREEAIRLHKDTALRGKVNRKQAEKLCNKFWGKEVTYEELKPTAKKLMQCPNRKF